MYALLVYRCKHIIEASNRNSEFSYSTICARIRAFNYFCSSRLPSHPRPQLVIKMYILWIAVYCIFTMTNTTRRYWTSFLRYKMKTQTLLKECLIANGILCVIFVALLMYYRHTELHPERRFRKQYSANIRRKPVWNLLFSGWERPENVQNPAEKSCNHLRLPFMADSDWIRTGFFDLEYSYSKW